MKEIVAKQPVGVAIHSNFGCLKSYSKGVITENDCNCSDPNRGDVNHAVTVIGYGKSDQSNCKGDYWLIKNSWNEEWGDGGLFKIARGVNECGIEESVSAGQISAPLPPSPSPTPTPPAPSPGPVTGNCESEAIADQATCENTLDIDSGNSCSWCYLSGLQIGFCVSNFICLSSLSDILILHLTIFFKQLKHTHSASYHPPSFHTFFHLMRCQLTERQRSVRGRIDLRPLTRF